MIALAIIAALAAIYLARRAYIRAQRRHESTEFIHIAPVADSLRAAAPSRGRFTASPVPFGGDDSSFLHAAVLDTNGKHNHG
ncbi:MAG: hypothetical protein ACKVOB_13285 [Sphingomonas sp.]